MSSLLILRPQPAAAETAARAAGMGLQSVVAPIFVLCAVDWDSPHSSEADAVMLTSANAPRFGGEALQGFVQLPCYAVGERTAAEARRMGFADVRTGESDVSALLALMARDGVSRLLHLSGRDHKRVEQQDMTILRRIVYSADAIQTLPTQADAALREGAVPLIHSPRAGSHFALLAEAAGHDRSRIRLAAISEAAAEAAGRGWAAKAIAEAPRDEALLELGAKLCKTGGSRDAGTSG